MSREATIAKLQALSKHKDGAGKTQEATSSLEARISQLEAQIKSLQTPRQEGA